MKLFKTNRDLQSLQLNLHKIKVLTNNKNNQFTNLHKKQQQLNQLKLLNNRILKKQMKKKYKITKMNKIKITNKERTKKEAKRTENELSIITKNIPFLYFI